MKFLICRTCQYSGAQPEPIALFNPTTIVLPLYASAFLPIDDESPFPPRGPDWPDVEWYFMHCPNCGGDPFGVPEITEEELQDLEYVEILTVDGPFIVPSERYRAKRAILFRQFESFPVRRVKKRPGRPLGSTDAKPRKRRK